MKYFLLAALLASESIYANSLANTNLISCDPSSGLQKNCHIQQDLQLIDKQSVESDFFVSYSMSCDRKYPGPLASKIAVKVSDGSSLTLNYKDSQTNILVGSGFGPLTMSDSLPNELGFRSFGSCDLVFSQIIAKPSQKVKAVWQSELDGVRALLTAKEKLVKSLEAVVALLPAYQFFESLADNLQTDLNQDQELIETAKKLSECSQGDNCDVLYKMSMNMDLNISMEERLLIIQLRTILAGVTPAGTPVKLSDRLSEQSIAILTKLAADASFYTNAQSGIETESKEIENLRGRIASLETLLAS